MCAQKNGLMLCALWLKRKYRKYHLNHFLLIFFYLIFITISAFTFYLIEFHSSELSRHRWQKRIDENRRRFIVNSLLPDIFNNTKLLLYVHGEKSEYLEHKIDALLNNYEQRHVKFKSPLQHFPITFLNSLFFVFSTITTTGHGYVQPVTNNGRIASMIISIIGLPFTIIVIKDFAYLLALLLHFPCQLLKNIWNIFRFCTLKPIDESALERELNNGDQPTIGDYRINHANRLLSIPVTVAILSLIGWMSIGVILMNYGYPHLPNSQNVYFIFNCLSTIAVHNVDISGFTPINFIIYFCYVIVGLSIVSLFINLLHTKFSNAYWLPGKFYFPLRSNPLPPPNIATFDSFEEITFSDIPVNHMASLGVFQTDDKCPLITVLKKNKAMHDVFIQTDESTLETHPIRASCRSSSPLMFNLPSNIGQSQEDVNDLIIETYGAKVLNKNY